MSKRTWVFLGLLGTAIVWGGGPLVPAVAGDKGTAEQMAELRILAALDQKTTIDFLDEPLTACVDFFKDFHGIEIQIDEPALEEMGVSTDEPITKQLREITFRSALNLLLRDLNLDWTITNEVLLITSPEVAEMNMVPRVYPVGELVKVRDAEGKIWQDFDALIDLLTSTVQPDSWEGAGGPGSIAIFELRGGAGIIIRHTPKVHHTVNRLLMELDKLAYKNGDDVYPTREREAISGTFSVGGTEMGLGGGMEMGPAEMDMMAQPAK